MSDAPRSWDEKAREIVRDAVAAIPEAGAEVFKAAAEGGVDWEKKAALAATVVIGKAVAPRVGATVLEQVDGWRRSAAERDLEDVRERMHLNIMNLIAQGVSPDDVASDAAATFEAWERAWRAASNRHVRRMVINGLDHSFDSDIYEEGLAVRMFELLEQLSYPDLVILRRAAASDHGLQIHTETASLNQEAVIRLRDLRLLYEPGMEFYETRPTELGARLLHFVEDRPLPTGPDDDGDPDPADTGSSDGA